MELQKQPLTMATAEVGVSVPVQLSDHPLASLHYPEVEQYVGVTFGHYFSTSTATMVVMELDCNSEEGH